MLAQVMPVYPPPPPPSLWPELGHTVYLTLLRSHTTKPQVFCGLPLPYVLLAQSTYTSLPNTLSPQCFLQYHGLHQR